MSLAELQTKVHVAKDKRNDFGGYSYRTAEGILAAIKANLPSGAHVTVSDDLQEVGGQIFVTATAKVWFPDDGDYSATAHAMHPLSKKGMDPSQITGAASSYARKYALAGLMALDDGSVDPDARKEDYDPVESEMDWFTANLPGMKTADAINQVLERAKKAGRDVAKLVTARANELGLEYDSTKRGYVYLEQHSDAA